MPSITASHSARPGTTSFVGRLFGRQLRGAALLLALAIAAVPRAGADPFPPDWGGPAVHFTPAPWPGEPLDPADCAHDCGEWIPYTRFQNDVADPRTQDPSNGGTRPQNYVNIASSCIDKSYPSIYYSLRKEPDTNVCAADAEACDSDVIMFRWRVEQVAHTYATGPSAGSFRATDPWSSALWTVLFDVDGDGVRDLAAHLDGSSGSPSEEIDLIAGIWGDIPTQSVDYSDPDIHLIAHNPTAFSSGSQLLNFHGDYPDTPPDTDWPPGSTAERWDYGTSRATLVYTNSCTEYFVDYQIPVKMLDASALGGPRLTRSSPLSMLFCTANSLNNPFQKDCALNKAWLADPGQPAPFGDYVSFNQAAAYRQPIVSAVEATAPADCAGDYRLSATVQDSLAVVDGQVVPSLQEVSFWYWYDADGDGAADDGGDWTLAANGTLTPGSLNQWTAAWNSSGLPKGKYLVGVQAVDNRLLHDDDVPDAPVDNRTFSYLEGSTDPATQSRIYSNDWSWDNATKSWIQGAAVGWIAGQEALFPGHAPTPMTPGSGEDWYGNPAVTGVQTAVVGTAINTCGKAPTLQKAVSDANPAAGATVDFTLTLTNELSSATTLSRITDSLPAGFSFVGNQAGGTLTPDTSPSSGDTDLAWDFSPSVSIAAGASETLVFRVNVPTTTGAYTNTAGAVTGFGPLVSNPVPVAVGDPRLTIAKTADSYSTTPGSTLTYTISYANDSPVDATGVTINDPLPAGLTYVADSCTDGCVYTTGPATLTWDIGDLAAGEGPFSVSFQVTVDTPYGGDASNRNTATIDSNETAATPATASVYVATPRPLLVLDKSAATALVAPGGNVLFTLSYANRGDTASTNTVLSDTLPDGFTLVSAKDPSGVDCTVSALCSSVGNTVTWNLGTLGVNDTGSVTVEAQAGNPFSGADNPATNTASLQSSEVTTPVTSSADVGVEQSGTVCTNYNFTDARVDVDPGAPDQQEYSAVAATPSGSATRIAALVPANSVKYEFARFYQDPASATQLDFSAGASIKGRIDYTKTNALGGSANTYLAIEVEIYDFDPATPSSNGQLLGAATLQPDNGAPSPPIWLTADYSETGAPFPLNFDLDKGHRLLWVFYGSTDGGSKNATTAEIFVNDPAVSYVTICAPPPANLVLDKSVDTPSVAVTGSGRTLTYTLKFSNTSDSADATGATLVDTLPSGVTYQSATLNGTAVSPVATAGQQLTFDVNSLGASIGTVAAGGSGALTITVAVADDLTGTSELVNSARIQSDQTAASPTGGATATTVVEGGGTSQGTTPDIVLTKLADDTSLIPGDVVTYTLIALNVGDKTATDLVVSDSLPVRAYVLYGGCNTATGGCGESGGTLTWNVGTLDPGQSATVTVTLSVTTSPAPPAGITGLDNQATASYTGGGTGSATSNLVRVFISTNPNLSLTKGVDPVSGAAPGDTLTYTLTVSNAGSGAATGVVVTDPIPANTGFKAVTQGSGDFDAVNNRVVFDVGELASSTSATLKFQVTVNSPLPAGTTILTNTATVSADNASSRQATAVGTADAAPLLALTKSGPTDIGLPAATLTAGVTNATTLPVDDTSQLAVGQYVMVEGGIGLITALGGNYIELNLPLTATAGAPVLASVTYSLAYRNTGNAAATSVQLSDPLPADMVYVGSSPAAATHPAPGANGTVTWALGTLAAGASGNVRLTVIPTQPGTYTNTANLGDPVYCTGATSPPACNADATTRAGGLVVHKRTTTPIVPASTGSPLQIAHYLIEVVNSTASAVNDVAVTDLLPPGFTYLAGSTTGAGEPSLALGADHPEWTLSVPADDSAIIEFDAEIGTEAGAATYQNGVDVSAAGAGIVQFDPLSTTAEDVTVLGLDQGLVEGHVFRDDGATPGALDAGDTPYANVRVQIHAADDDCSDPYSATCFLLDTDGDGYFQRVVPIGDWVVEVVHGSGDLPAGEFQVVGGNPDTVTILAQGSANDDNGFSQDTPTDSDMSVTISIPPGTVNPGQVVNGTVTCANLGPAAADTATCTLTGGTLSNCVQNPGGTGLVLPAGSLPANSSIVCDLSATAPASGTLTLTANTGATNDNNQANNQDVVEREILYTDVFDPPSGLKTVDSRGDPVYRWRMVWINSGNTVANAVRIEDPIPAGTDFVPGSLTCEERGASTRITCTFEAAQDRVIWEGSIAPDFGQTTEAGALNEVVITFDTRLQDGVDYAENLANAYWDANGVGGVADDMAQAQSPVQTNDGAPIGPGGAQSIPVMSPAGAVVMTWLLLLVGMRQLPGRARP